MMETFENDKQKKQETTVISDRYLLFQAGMQCFFTTFEKTASLKPDAFLNWIRENDHLIYFWPNYQDICCKMNSQDDKDADALGNRTIRDDCDCDNIDIRMSSHEDTGYKYSDETRLTSTDSLLSATNKNNCIVTLLGNDYMVQKRTVKMELRDRERVNKTNEMYRLVIHHEHPISFVLSRPLLLSFSGSGIAAVLHEDYDKATGLEEFEDKKDRNLFSYFFSARDKANHNILVREFKDGKLPMLENTSIFNTSHSSHSMTFDGQPKIKACTLYYLSFHREVMQIPHAYAVNFYVNKDLMNEKADAINMTLELEHDNPLLLDTVSFFKQDRTLKLKLNDMVYSLPEEFDVHDPYFSKYDVVFTLAFDVLIIVCLAREVQSDQSIVLTKRYHLKKRFESTKEFLHDAFRTQVPKMYHHIENNKAGEMVLTGIPDYAKLAHNLGYMKHT